VDGPFLHIGSGITQPFRYVVTVFPFKTGPIVILLVMTAEDIQASVRSHHGRRIGRKGIPEEGIPPVPESVFAPLVLLIAGNEEEGREK
jgi:hypothetical protein